MIQAAIFGASGYSGIELVHLLATHPDVNIAATTSRSFIGQTLDQINPTAPALKLIDSENVSLSEIDVAFLCLPHSAAAETAVQCLEAGVRVIDLSADFRIRDANLYEKWYGQPHPAPELLKTAVYGLTECARAYLPDCQLVANPGCYPTSILLPLLPWLHSQHTITGPIIADSKSGVSGAGRTPIQTTHFVEVSNNLSPYNIGRQHRHLPEIEQMMHLWQADAPQLIFSPHLLPIPRGMLSTIYVTLQAPLTDTEVVDLYGRFYQEEPFIKLLPLGQVATIAHVTHTNRCAIGLTLAGNTVVITSAIDNLQKGAAGQAVQNMNVMFGLEETLGLRT